MKLAAALPLLLPKHMKNGNRPAEWCSDGIPLQAAMVAPRLDCHSRIQNTTEIAKVQWRTYVIVMIALG